MSTLLLAAEAAEAGGHTDLAFPLLPIITLLPVLGAIFIALLPKRRPELARMEYDEPGPALEAWRQGRTGFPIVDAGLRQLRGSGWVHNRVRMIVASFLVKDLHVEWRHGARHFMEWLVDGDLASNQHGWQWVAGSGTDAAPFFRVFNPVAQGRRFDPDGAYVRRWVPELADVHDPHDPDPGTRERTGYPAPIVDHAEERREALARWERIRS